MKQMASLILVLMSGTLTFAMPIQIKVANSGQAEIILDCKIAGQDSKCLLDTGAQASSLSSSYPIENLKVLRQFERRSLTKEPIKCDVVEVPDFSSLGETVTNYEMSYCKEAKQKENRVGAPFFTKPFVLDIQNQDLSWGSPPEGIALQPLQVLRGGHLVVDVMMGEDRIGAVFDTGAAFSLIDNDYAEANLDMSYYSTGVPDPKKKFVMIGLNPVPSVDANGNIIRTKLYKVTRLSINGVNMDGMMVRGYVFPPKMKEYFGPAVPMILGIDDVHQMSWYFDIPNKKWANWFSVTQPGN